MRVEVEDVGAVVLTTYQPSFDLANLFRSNVIRTSFPATGHPTRLTCVSFMNPCKGSRSASSERLFCVSTSVLRFGMLFDRLGCILAIRLRAHSRVCNRGESGKLERVAMSLSVKSMDSWSCRHVSPHSHPTATPFHSTHSIIHWCVMKTYLRSNTQVLD